MICKDCGSPLDLDEILDSGDPFDYLLDAGGPKRVYMTTSAPSRRYIEVDDGGDDVDRIYTSEYEPDPFEASSTLAESERFILNDLVVPQITDITSGPASLDDGDSDDDDFSTAGGRVNSLLSAVKELSVYNAFLGKSDD